ncbi:MAG: hypothetical protein V8Q71_00125 [Bacilli bacterium]|jgi:hypothetical protein
MGLNNFVLTCEKDNEELRKDINYYKNMTSRLKKENQELNKQVEVSNELVAQGTLTEMKLRNEVNRWRKEYQDTYKDVRIEIKEYKTQQKEFIKYLEDEINKLVKEYGNYVYDDYSEEKGKYDSYQEILQKYKEIIGDDK